MVGVTLAAGVALAKAKAKGMEVGVRGWVRWWVRNAGTLGWGGGLEEGGAHGVHVWIVRCLQQLLSVCALSDAAWWHAASKVSEGRASLSPHWFRG